MTYSAFDLSVQDLENPDGGFDHRPRSVQAHALDAAAFGMAKHCATYVKGIRIQGRHEPFGLQPERPLTLSGGLLIFAISAAPPFALSTFLAATHTYFIWGL